MKRILALFIVLGGLLSAVSCHNQTPTEKAMTDSYKAMDAAVPIPSVSYFQERRTIVKWTERWDKPAVATYVYLVSFGKILGYYVADGKPASTRSYLFPEEYYYSGTTLPSADVDGTYGTNNPGIRFFTAGGTAVEWGGDGASYIYSDAPLPIDVPRLEVAKK